MYSNPCSTFGTDVILLHGLFETPESVTPLASLLARSPGIGHVYAPALPPLNGASCQSLDDIVKSMEKYLRNQPLGRQPILVGYSFGATIATALFAELPFFFNRRLVLITPPCHTNYPLVPLSPLVPLFVKARDYTRAAIATQFSIAMKNSVDSALSPLFRNPIPTIYPSPLLITTVGDRHAPVEKVRTLAEKIRSYSDATRLFVISDKIPEPETLIADEIVEFLKTPTHIGVNPFV